VVKGNELMWAFTSSEDHSVHLLSIVLSSPSPLEAWTSLTAKVGKTYI
jgi:hypothetical protein